MATYSDLTAWQLAHQLVLHTYRVTAGLPSEERFGLVSQARRESFSIAANIAEGQAKRGRREFRRFLDIALGSLAELSYALLLAKDLGYLAENEWEAIEKRRAEVGRVLWGLYRAVSEGKARKD